MAGEGLQQVARLGVPKLCRHVAGGGEHLLTVERKHGLADAIGVTSEGVHGLARRRVPEHGGAIVASREHELAGAGGEKTAPFTSDTNIWLRHTV